MNRNKCVNEIVESIQRTKHNVCGRLPKMPEVSISPAQWAVLHILHTQDNLSIKQLANSLSITGSAVTQLTKDLEEKKLIKRVPDPTDRRYINIQLTAKYKKIMASVHRAFTKECTAIFAKLSDKELETLNKLHKKLTS